MRLFRLELKRILKSRRTVILLVIALLLSVAMAYLPISFEGINRRTKMGRLQNWMAWLLSSIKKIFMKHLLVK